MKLKKGDQVRIMSGKDRGKTGTVLIAFPTDEKIIVDNLNLFKKRSKPKKQGESGQIVQVARPMPASKVMIVCGNCKNPTRIGYRTESGSKIRFCKKCKANL